MATRVTLSHDVLVKDATALGDDTALGDATALGDLP